MNFKTYRIAIFISVIIICIVSSIYFFASNIVQVSASFAEIFFSDIVEKISTTYTPTIIKKDPILINTIISKRYLYTLTKVIEEKLSKLS